MSWLTDALREAGLGVLIRRVLALLLAAALGAVTQDVLVPDAPAPAPPLVQSE